MNRICSLFINPLVRALYPIGSVRTVFRGQLRGQKFIVQPGMGAMFALGGAGALYNYKFFSFMIRPGQKVFDIGGNCGQMALLFSRLVGPDGLVVSFEPVPRNCELLRRNVALNDCTNVQIQQIAVGRQKSRRKFSYEDAHHAQGTLVDALPVNNAWKDTIEVECDSVDNIVEATGIVPSLLKIDVEGGGAEVIAGAGRLLDRHAPDISFEMHSSTEECPEYKCVRELESLHGYQLRTFQGEPVRNLTPGWGSQIWCRKAI